MAKKKEKATKRCTKCGEEKVINSDNFYKSYSVLFQSTEENRMCVCKSCVLELAENLRLKFGTHNKALHELCKLLDIYYEKNAFESAVKQAGDKSNVFQIYFQKILSLPQYKGKVYLDSNVFEKEINTSDDDTMINVVEFWGEGYTQQEYDFLENEYGNLTTRYECDSYSQEVLFQEIANQRLDIKKKRQSGASVEKELKTLQELLGSANIKPSQESASMSNEQVTFGTLIKKFENEKPIPKPLPEWMTFDWIRKYVVTFFFGNLSEMMGKKNVHEEEYKKEMSLYTVKLNDEEGVEE